MIRREDGSDWLIISQIDHAHLAAELAGAWRHPGDGKSTVTDLLLHAIRCHDDGWREWDAHPEIDPENGIPRQFTEMPMETATPIWASSIQRAALEHPLCGIWVGRHFCHLAEQSLDSRSDEHDDVEAINLFLKQQLVFQHALEKEARQDMTKQEIDALSRFGFAFLRLFDGLSLWFCCKEATKPFHIRFAGQAVELKPLGDGVVEVEPDVLMASPIQFTVTARRIPAERLADNNELRRRLESAAIDRLQWRLSAVEQV